VVPGAEQLLQTGQLPTDRAQRTQVILLHAVAGSTAGASPSVLAAPETNLTLMPTPVVIPPSRVGQDTRICTS
jgi:hypothetical protein